MKQKSSNRQNKHLLSVIIPSYKGEKTIENNLEKVKEVLDTLRYDYEIICVVDGKVDNTLQKAKKVAKKYPKKIKVTGYLTNLGKGHAVRYGMAQAKGDTVAFIDAGIELNPNGLSMLLEHFEWYGADIVVGSKRHPASKVSYPLQRRILSIGYQLLVRLLFGVKVRDTQVGMKFFKRNILEEALPRLLVKRYAFDIEILAVSHYLGFKKIFEAPIELKYDFKDIVHASDWKQIFFMLWDTFAVFYRLKILRYYDNKKQEKLDYSKLSDPQ